MERKNKLRKINSEETARGGVAPAHPPKDSSKNKFLKI